MHKKISLFLFLVFAVYGCKKEDIGSPLFNIRYEVDEISGNSIDVSYYSDLYYDNEEIKKITINPKGTQYLSNYWSAERLQTNKTQGYYIRVDYKKYVSPKTARQRVNVYLNDTVLINSFRGDSIIDFVELQGTIPKEF